MFSPRLPYRFSVFRRMARRMARRLAPEVASLRCARSEEVWRWRPLPSRVSPRVLWQVARVALIAVVPLRVSSSPSSPTLRMRRLSARRLSGVATEQRVRRGAVRSHHGAPSLFNASAPTRSSAESGRSGPSHVVQSNPVQRRLARGTPEGQFRSAGHLRVVFGSFRQAHTCAAQCPQRVSRRVRMVCRARMVRS